MKIAKLIHITGIVQGVGFRPYVYNLAHEYGLVGWVLNASDGVHIFAQGDESSVLEFLEALPLRAPRMSAIDAIRAEEVPCEDKNSFEIRTSENDTAAVTLISPDIATCPECVSELFDENDRRFHYPFINCTQCGPRFTIIDDLPYDRPKTSMKNFEMCEECSAEYHDPADRRFHAQPDACFTCGPELFWLEDGKTHYAHDLSSSDALIENASRYLLAGKILALKGLGGYHLACDATNEEAVALLRERKRRPAKPFAVMVPDLESAQHFCEINEAESELLSGTARPIVLLTKSRNPAAETALAPGVAKNLNEIGVMLPYTPLQHLLLAAITRPLVMTSGNLSEEPILSQDNEAREFLSPLSDALLGNNRQILSRYDDSVVRVIDGRTVFVRRARGFAPTPLKLPSSLVDEPSLLACGPEQKNTFCFTRGDKAFVSQHLGDLENALTWEAWEETVELYERLFDLKPTRLACDMHPEYLSTKWAKEQAKAKAVPLEIVQHHHAHIAAVTAEHDIDQRVVGITLDGTGYGTDKTIWGGEILVADWRGFERSAHLRTFPLPGGAAAVKNPCRMAWSILLACGLQDHPGAALLKSTMTQDELSLVAQMIDKDLNCPPTSSAGRLLDAVSALLGICSRASYDGEPAIALEAALYDTDDEAQTNTYDFFVAEDIIDPAPAFASALDDMVCGCSPNIIAKRFHEAFARAIVSVAANTARKHDCSIVALSGGVFMNRYLLTNITRELETQGLRVLTGKHLPANDGCIAYGQAVIALARAKA